jgi:hypothetical protein
VSVLHFDIVDSFDDWSYFAAPPSLSCRSLRAMLSHDCSLWSTSPKKISANLEGTGLLERSLFYVALVDMSQWLIGATEQLHWPLVDANPSRNLRSQIHVALDSIGAACPEAARRVEYLPNEKQRIVDELELLRVVPGYVIAHFCSPLHRLFEQALCDLSANESNRLLMSYYGEVLGAMGDTDSGASAIYALQSDPDRSSPIFSLFFDMFSPDELIVPESLKALAAIDDVVNEGPGAAEEALRGLQRWIYMSVKELYVSLIVNVFLRQHVSKAIASLSTSSLEVEIRGYISRGKILLDSLEPHNVIEKVIAPALNVPPEALRERDWDGLLSWVGKRPALGGPQLVEPRRVLYNVFSEPKLLEGAREARLTAAADLNVISKLRFWFVPLSLIAETWQLAGSIRSFRDEPSTANSIGLVGSSFDLAVVAVDGIELIGAFKNFAVLPAGLARLVRFAPVLNLLANICDFAEFSARANVASQDGDTRVATANAVSAMGAAIGTAGSAMLIFGAVGSMAGPFGWALLALSVPIILLGQFALPAVVDGNASDGESLAYVDFADHCYLGINRNSIHKTEPRWSPCALPVEGLARVSFDRYSRGVRAVDAENSRYVVEAELARRLMNRFHVSPLVERLLPSIAEGSHYSLGCLVTFAMPIPVGLSLEIEFWMRGSRVIYETDAQVDVWEHVGVVRLRRITGANADTRMSASGLALEFRRLGDAYATMTSEFAIDVRIAAPFNRHIRVSALVRSYICRESQDAWCDESEFLPVMPVEAGQFVNCLLIDNGAVATRGFGSMDVALWTDRRGTRAGIESHSAADSLMWNPAARVGLP